MQKDSEVRFSLLINEYESKQERKQTLHDEKLNVKKN